MYDCIYVYIYVHAYEYNDDATWSNTIDVCCMLPGVAHTITP